MFKLLISILVISLSFPVLACKCVDTSEENRVKEADFIYIGVIQSANLIKDNLVESKLKIIEPIKGSPDTNLLTSYAEEHMCAVFPAVGLKYVVFGKNGNTPHLGYCSDTRIILDETRDIVKAVKKAANKQINQDK
jgi:hypothetical protein